MPDCPTQSSELLANNAMVQRPNTTTERLSDSSGCFDAFSVTNDNCRSNQLLPHLPATLALTHEFGVCAM
jgi:hypothetical protein